MKKLIAILLAAALVLCLCACGETSGDGTSASDSDQKTFKVGVCQLIQHPALDSATQGFVDTLKEKLGDSVVIDVQNASGDAPTCAAICSGFVSSGYDLILANATPALEAAASATGDIPILGTSVTDYATALDIDDWTGTAGGNISGTSDLAPLDKQADMVKELFPDAKNVGILFCSGEPNSVYQVKTITPMFEALGFTVTEYSFADSNDISPVTSTACAGSDVIYIPTDNTAASCTEAINNVALVAGVPIVAGEQGTCSGCGVAALSIDYYELGCMTGEMAWEILANGADISTMAIQSAPEAVKVYNADICAKLGVTVPADYTAIVSD